jgi:hypothetical protein
MYAVGQGTRNRAVSLESVDISTLITISINGEMTLSTPAQTFHTSIQ